MKKLLIIGLSAIALVACESLAEEDSSTSETNTTEEVESTETSSSEETSESSENETSTGDETEQIGTVSESDIGTKTVNGINYDVAESLTTGPFTINVNKAQLSQFAVNTDYVEMLGGEDLASVVIDLEVINDSEDTNAIYPDQGTIVTDTGAQVDAEVFLSDSVGGDFMGEVTKEGQVIFLWEGNSEEVSSIRYVVDGPYDEEFNSLGEELEFEIEFEK